MFGKHIENEMEIAENRLPDNAKDKARRTARQRVLDRYLGVDQASAGRFREPVKR